MTFMASVKTVVLINSILQKSVSRYTYPVFRTLKFHRVNIFTVVINYKSSALKWGGPFLINGINGITYKILEINNT